jgi:hypothetical protein
MAGWGSAVYSYRRCIIVTVFLHFPLRLTDTTMLSQYWLWCGVIGPIIGAQLGAAVYDLFIYTGEDSLVSQS